MKSIAGVSFLLAALWVSGVQAQGSDAGGTQARVTLHDGSVIKGEVLEAKRSKVVIRSTYGDMTLARRNIKTFEFDEEVEPIPLSGVKRPAKRGRLLKYQAYSYQRAHTMPTGRLANFIGSGGSDILAGQFGFWRQRYIPHLRTELGLHSFGYSFGRIWGFSGAFGPAWRLQLIKKHRGVFDFAMTAGLVYLRLPQVGLKYNSNSLLFNARAGYGYPVYRKVLLAVSGHYSYIYDFFLTRRSYTSNRSLNLRGFGFGIALIYQP